MKIVSLVPSLTKTICDLGLRDQIAGITNFCVDPPDLYRQAQRVGGTKDPNLDLLTQIAPTHVLVNEEENRAADLDYIKSRFNTLVTFPKSPEDVPELLNSMGRFLGKTYEAQRLAVRVQESMDAAKLNCTLSQNLGRNFVYLIWRDPWMVAGRDTYISRFLELLGFHNVVDLPTRYPIIDHKNLSRESVDIVFLSSEPWPFRRRDADYLRKALGHACPKLYWIDGKALSWYGTTTLEALQAIKGNTEACLIKDI